MTINLGAWGRINVQALDSLLVYVELPLGVPDFSRFETDSLIWSLDWVGGGNVVTVVTCTRRVRQNDDHNDGFITYCLSIRRWIICGSDFYKTRQSIVFLPCSKTMMMPYFTGCRIANVVRLYLLTLAQTNIVSKNGNWSCIFLNTTERWDMLWLELSHVFITTSLGIWIFVHHHKKSSLFRCVVPNTLVICCHHHSGEHKPHISPAFENFSFCSAWVRSAYV